MANAPELVFDLIFGRWRSQTLYAGAALGVFDQLSNQPRTAAVLGGTAHSSVSRMARDRPEVCLRTHQGVNVFKSSFS